MQAALTVEDFSKLMKSEQQESVLQQLLHQLTTLNRPEEVQVLRHVRTHFYWTGWW